MEGREGGKRARTLRDAPSEDLLSEVSQRCHDLAAQERRLSDLEGRVLAVTRDPGEVLDVNAGGQVFSVRRDTLCAVEGSVLAALFSGSWEEGQSRDSQGRPFLDVDPYVFGEIVNYLRLKRIEGPESPAPLPVVAAGKRAQFRFVAEYYGLAEHVCPTKLQTLSRSDGRVKSCTIEEPCGYYLEVSNPIRLHAVGVAASGPAGGVLVGVGTDDIVLREIVASPVQPLPPKWEAADAAVTRIAKGFDYTMEPPGGFIYVFADDRVPPSSIKYVSGTREEARDIGLFTVTSKLNLPMEDTSMCVCLCLEFSELSSAA